METDITVKYILYIGINCKTLSPVPKYLKSGYPQYPNQGKPYIGYYRHKKKKEYIIYIANYMFNVIARFLIKRNGNNNTDNFIVAGFATLMRNNKNPIYGIRKSITA